MNKLDPSVNYANPGNDSKTEMESLRDSVNAMCTMWNEIAKEMNSRGSGKQAKVLVQKQPSVSQAPTRYSLTAEGISDIVNANMGQEQGTENEDNEEENDTHESANFESPDKRSLYDDMFENE